jgi:hypothetical protein
VIELASKVHGEETPAHFTEILTLRIKSLTKFEKYVVW